MKFIRKHLNHVLFLVSWILVGVVESWWLVKWVDPDLRRHQDLKGVIGHGVMSAALPCPHDMLSFYEPRGARSFYCTYHISLAHWLISSSCRFNRNINPIRTSLEQGKPCMFPMKIFHLKGNKGHISSFQRHPGCRAVVTAGSSGCSWKIWRRRKRYGCKWSASDWSHIGVSILMGVPQ